MKLAIVNNFHPYSGIGKAAFNLFDNYRKNNKNVEMFYFESSKTRIKNQVGINKVAGSNILFLDKGLLSYFYFPWKIPKGFDLYHASNQYLAFLAKRRRPCIVTHHDIIPILVGRGLSMRIISVIMNQLIKFYKYADKIIAISEVVKDELLKYYMVSESKVEVIYEGYDEKFYKPISKKQARRKLNLPEDSQIVLNVGSEDYIKNLPMLFKAMEQIQRMFPDVIFLRVGKGKKSGVGGNVDNTLKSRVNLMEFRDVDEKLMPYFYNSADVSVFPLLYGGGFIFPALESMACGTPTIVSDELRVFEKGCLVIEELNLENLTDAIHKVLASKALRENLSRKGSRCAKNFTLKKQLYETWNVYEEVVGED